MGEEKERGGRERVEREGGGGREKDEMSRC